MKRFEGKKVLVTGGSTGIGYASAKLFVLEGAEVIIAARSDRDLKAAADELGSKAIPIVCDVSSLQDLSKMFDQVKDRFGELDAVFVNAGIAPFAPFSQVDEVSYDKIFDVNLKGAFFTAQKAIPLMKKGGSLVFNTSVVNVKGFPGTSVYSASKAGLRSFVRTLAAEASELGVRINAVAPGPIETPIYGKLGLPPEAVEEMGKSFASQVPLKRFGTPDEVARTVAFLASDESSFIHGVEIAVDGGLSQV